MKRVVEGSWAREHGKVNTLRGCRATGEHTVTREARVRGGKVADTHSVIGAARRQGGR